MAGRAVDELNVRRPQKSEFTFFFYIFKSITVRHLHNQDTNLTQVQHPPGALLPIIGSTTGKDLLGSPSIHNSGVLWWCLGSLSDYIYPVQRCDISYDELNYQESWRNCNSFAIIVAEVLERPTGSQITISNNSLRAYVTLAYFSFLLMLSSLQSNVSEQSRR